MRAGGEAANRGRSGRGAGRYRNCPAALYQTGLSLEFLPLIQGYVPLLRINGATQKIALFENTGSAYPLRRRAMAPAPARKVRYSSPEAGRGRLVYSPEIALVSTSKAPSVGPEPSGRAIPRRSVGGAYLGSAAPESGPPAIGR